MVMACMVLPADKIQVSVDAREDAWAVWSAAKAREGVGATAHQPDQDPPLESEKKKRDGSKPRIA